MPRFLTYLLAACLGMMMHVAAAVEKPFQMMGLHFPQAEVVSPNTIRIPFQLIDHLIVVRASTHEREGNFIIDTGSETLVLNEVHCKNYRKTNYRSASGVNGRIDNAYLKELDSFFFENFSIDNLTADVVNLSHIEESKKMELYGIIGYSVLKEYEVFIDFYLKQITLFKTDDKGERIDRDGLLEKVSDSLSFTQKKHSIMLEAFVNGERLIFGLDSGAEINQLSTTVSKKVLKNFKILQRINIIGADKGEREVLAGKLYRISFGKRLYYGLMRTLLTNLSGMYEAYGAPLDGVVGYEFLAMRRTLINYKKKRLYFIDFPFTSTL